MSVEHFQALAKGVRLNQYEMIGILGAGGFGITYMARDTTLDTMVAIKEYLPGDFAVRQRDSQVTAKSSTSKGDFDWGLSRFLDEARVLAKFRHPNIVRVNQIFEANNTAYIVMDYAKGESLDDLLKRVGPLSEQQTKDILFPILDGLKRVHALGFLHRDIKPANIIIRDEGGAVLIDFGAARQAIETKSRAITSIVTEGYAPLEQYDTAGNQGAWTDIYALGGVAYKCLTGNKPPAATSRLRNDPLVPAGNRRTRPRLQGICRGDRFGARRLREPAASEHRRVYGDRFRCGSGSRSHVFGRRDGRMAMDAPRPSRTRLRAGAQAPLSGSARRPSPRRQE